MPQYNPSTGERQSHPNAPRCKHCGAASRSVRFGRHKGRQKWLCRACGRVWTDNGAASGMRVAAAVVARARELRKQGLSLRAIRDELGRRYGVRPGISTIHGWTRRAGAGYVAQEAQGWLPGESPEVA